MQKMPTPPDFGPEFHERLREWRDTVGLSQEALAELLGISYRQILRWEKSPGDEKAQEPTGKAADTWRAFRDGNLPDRIEADIRGLSARLRKISGIFFQDAEPY